ncbi:DKNYY domain-containing protein [Chryseobacterium sp.]|uniref:DKNYY domain-containing protein n=1 Tax=Chryseobacterium sp. TaxID=1871047 RepID=UPI00321A1BE7
MKYILFLFPFIFSAKIHAQTRILKNPVVNTGLFVFEEPNLKFDTYLVNKDYVIFQGENGIRKVTEADTQSFSFNHELGRNKDGIFIKGDFVKTDTLGYKNMWSADDEYFWRTKTKIYNNITEVKDLNASEFTLLKSSTEYGSSEYYQYNGQVYYHDKLLKDADVHTAVVDYNRYYDKNGVYDQGERLLFEGVPVTYLNSHLQTAKNQILSWGKVLVRSDAASFTQLKGDYSKDKNQVYYAGSVIKEADVASFVSVNEHYAKDKNHVYYGEDVVTDADPETFAHLKDLYTKDKNHVYYQNMIVPIDITDDGKLKIWNTDYTYTFITDGKKIFLGESQVKIPKFDARSFGVVGKNALCYDKNGIYIIGEDRKTRQTVYKKIPFKYSGPVNGKDITVDDELSGYVFYKDQIYSTHHYANLFNKLTQERINMLKSTGKDLTKAKGLIQYETHYYWQVGKAGNKIYWENKETSADAETFEGIKGSFRYFKDKKNVYLFSIENGLSILKGVDRKSARIFNGFLADKNYIYTDAHRVIKSENIELLAVYEGFWPMCTVGNPVASTYYVFKNTEGYWLALIPSRGKVEVNKISAADPALKKFLIIK